MLESVTGLKGESHEPLDFQVDDPVQAVLLGSNKDLNVALVPE